MFTVWQIVYLLLWIFRWLLLLRIVFDVVRIFARSWRPSGFGAVVLEFLYMITDPPIKLLRRVIKPVRLGGVSLDLSVMVILIVVMLLMAIVEKLMYSSLMA